MEDIKNILKGDYIIYHDVIENETSLEKIHSLYTKDTIFEPVDGIECLFVGLYYRCVKSDSVNAEKYFLEAINHGNTSAMLNLAVLLENKKDFKDAFKYHLMAVEHDNFDAVNNFSLTIAKNETYENVTRYYLMAIEKGNVKAMRDLAKYYKKKKDNDRVQKYYLMAIECKDVTAMYELACHYCDINCYDLAEKNFELAMDHGSDLAKTKLISLCKKTDEFKLVNFYIKHGDKFDRKKIIKHIRKIWNSKMDDKYNDSLIELIQSFKFLPNDDIPTSLRMFVNLINQNIDVEFLHSKYTLENKQYEQAEKDFIDAIIKDI